MHMALKGYIHLICCVSKNSGTQSCLLEYINVIIMF